LGRHVEGLFSGPEGGYVEKIAKGQTSWRGARISNPLKKIKIHEVLGYFPAREVQVVAGGNPTKNQVIIFGISR